MFVLNLSDDDLRRVVDAHYQGRTVTLELASGEQVEITPGSTEDEEA